MSTRVIASVEEGCKKMDVSEARKSFADLLSQVGFGRERVVLCRNGKKVAALIPMADLEFLEKREEEYDAAAARKALANPVRHSSAAARKKLGLQ
jgi:prevent-host-death family protein